MEPFYDDIEDEKEYLARRAQRKARMLREKKRRQKQRMIAAFLGIGVICIAMIVFCGKDAKKAEANQEQTQIQEDNRIQDYNAEDESETVGVEEVEQESESLKTENETEGTSPIYRFKETAETTGVYSDAVISTHALLIDESADTIIASKGARDRISPASMTKVLTVLVAAEHITEEQLDDTFNMTIDITDYSYVNDCSNVGFLVDEKVPVKDLFYGTILPSGGDAAVGLATYVAGSHEAFVELMNKKLEELGLSDTAHFTNCVGLYDENHYCTLYDMAVIMKAALQNELCREVLKERCYTTTPTEQHPEGITISNWFLRRIEDKDTGGEVAGAKTGFVNESGSCAVSYQIADNGVTYICVTAGSSSSWRCIYDHVEIYNRYIPGNNAAVSEE